MKIFYSIVFLLIVSGSALFSITKDTTMQGDKPAKHYFKNCFYYNSYGTSERELDNKKLGKYKFSESSIGFFIPFFTKDYYSKDSLTISNIHLLVVGNSTLSKPRFSALQNTHNLTKTSLGLRIFYNSGKKNVFFFNASPFLIHDNFNPASASLRYASVFVFNRTVSEKFSYRLGFAKTFLFGNRYTLPIIGFRFGSLDGVHMNMILPRNLSVNFPLTKNLTGSVYVKPLGGLFNFMNNDTLYSGNDEVIQFGRYELLNGIRLDYDKNNFNFYFSVGITKRNLIALASTSYSKNKRGVVVPFYTEKMDGATFLNLGLNYKFGKVKKVYNNYTMYDMFDINNANLPGDDNGNLSNNEIPKKVNEKDIKKIQYRDVQDLIELEDIY